MFQNIQLSHTFSYVHGKAEVDLVQLFKTSDLHNKASCPDIRWVREGEESAAWGVAVHARTYVVQSREKGNARL